MIAAVSLRNREAERNDLEAPPVEVIADMKGQHVGVDLCFRANQQRLINPAIGIAAHLLPLTPGIAGIKNMEIDRHVLRWSAVRCIKNMSRQPAHLRLPPKNSYRAFAVREREMRGNNTNE